MTVSLLGRSDVFALLASDDFRPRKRLGQNFVVDPNTIRRIVRLAGVREGDRVLEIGPGLGSLTLGLLGAGASVTCIEKDAELASLLRTTLTSRASDASVHIVVGDALNVDLDELLGYARSNSGPTDFSWSLVANLPYNVSTPIVLRVLEEAPLVETMLVMVQREVADRMVATPRTKSYGAPSVRIALDASARIVGLVGPDVFHPRPRVDSALVELKRGGTNIARPIDRARCIHLIRSAFGQRRKTLRRSLGLSAEDLERLGLTPDARPEELDPATWVRVSDGLSV